MNLNQAISKHIEWKVKFMSTILKQESMDTETISNDNCCELGKWLHEDGKTQFENLASYAICLEKHVTFHLEAGKIAAKIGTLHFCQKVVNSSNSKHKHPSGFPDIFLKPSLENG